MKRRAFLKTTGTGLSALAVSGLSASCDLRRKKPNIILIMADDFGYECLSCNGSTSYSTPHIERLAAEGIRFTNCFSMPLCTPSRVQLMTGKYNFRNYTEFGTLRPGETTFAHLFKNAGYKTCVAGKWQLVGHYENSNYKGIGSYPAEAGFDEYCLWQLDRFGSRYWKPLLVNNGMEIQGTEDEYGPDIVCDFVLDFMERHHADPFFIYYPMILTHDPFVPTPDTAHTPEEKYKNNPRFFADMVQYTDKLVGRVLHKLEQLKLQENTLVIFTGDNGNHKSISSEMDGQTVTGAKGQTCDPGIHVPLVIDWKGRSAKGAVCDDLIDFTDIFPTLLDAGGIPRPGDLLLDGRSFIPQVKGQKGNPREWIFCHYDPKWGKWEKCRFVRTKQRKLYDDGRLYDLHFDPLESQPVLAGDPQDHTEVRASLQLVLDSMK